eukprot:SAG31_NODE_10501_length_1131_cov_1.136628_2_plen_197_part_00
MHAAGPAEQTATRTHVHPGAGLAEQAARMRVAACAMLLLCAMASACGGSPLPAQGQHCFVEQAWTRAQIVQQKAVPFGKVFNNATKEMQTLLLDTYEPPATDKRAERPAFVLIHGGAFIFGNRTSDGEPEVAYALATRGYFVVSIDYRLTGLYWGGRARLRLEQRLESPLPRHRPNRHRRDGGRQGRHPLLALQGC